MSCQPIKKLAKGIEKKVNEAHPRQWVRFGLAIFLLLSFVVWFRTPLCLLLFPLLFDLYITKYLQYTSWKRSDKIWLRILIRCLNVSGYIFIIVYLVFIFIGQIFIIPSSSMENSLLTGDIVWVDKITYGPRIPITPINIPFFHNTIPVINSDSYSEVPTLQYRRLNGLRQIKNNDIVVFNLPIADTISTKHETSPFSYEFLINQYGWAKVNTDKSKFGHIKYQPVDRRPNYIKRIAATPGQIIRIVNDTVYIDSNKQKFPKNALFRCILASENQLTLGDIEELKIAPNKCIKINREELDQDIISYLPSNSKYFLDAYLAANKLDYIKVDTTNSIKVIRLASWMEDVPLFPNELSQTWSLSNWGGEDGVRVPAKGLTVKINNHTWPIYRRCIKNYENNTSATFDGSTLYIDGKECTEYTFKMDYYFVLGDNRYNSYDSRYWGFVPEDHIVGHPLFIAASIDNVFNTFRSHRYFKPIKN